MLRVGLTGGIACGKSEVRRHLADSGLETLDLDPLAHDLMAPGQPAHRDAVLVFGPGILAADGTIDRRRLGAIVFADAAARDRLNDIVHPRVLAEEDHRARRLAAEPAAVLVTDAALLVEAGAHLRYDRLVVVACRPDQQIARLMARDDVSESAARARVVAQMPVETKRRFAHTVVDTSGTVDDTRRATAELARELQDLARADRVSAVMPRARVVGALRHGPEHGPRGLSPVVLAEHLVTTGGLDLKRLSRHLQPGAGGPWFEAGDATVASRGEPSALVGPLVLFLLARVGYDPSRIAASAFSLAWLTERGAERLASAVQLALILGEVAVAGGVPHDIQGLSRRSAAEARRWGRGDPGPEIEAALRAAQSHAHDPVRARARAAELGAEPGLAGMIVGLATGAPAEEPGPFTSFVEAIA